MGPSPEDGAATISAGPLEGGENWEARKERENGYLQAPFGSFGHLLFNMSTSELTTSDL